MSLLHALFYTRSNADLETLLAVDRGAQQDRVVGGSVRVAEAMAGRLGERVRLGQPVRRVAQDAHSVRVTTRTGDTFEADVAVVTLPPALAGRLEHDPPLPSWRDQLTQRMPAGSVIKVFAVYDEPFWRHEGLNGQAASDVGPVKVTFDNSPTVRHAGDPDGLLRGEDGGCGRAVPRPSGAAAAIGCFTRYFGPRAARPTRYVERDWMAEEFTPGVLRRALRAGGVDVVRRGVARAGRADPLGGRRVRAGVERLHGGRGPQRRGGGATDRRGR